MHGRRCWVSAPKQRVTKASPRGGFVTPVPKGWVFPGVSGWEGPEGIPCNLLEAQ